jgi:hypothetical protein
LGVELCGYHTRYNGLFFGILQPSSIYAIVSAGTMNKASGRSLKVMPQPTPNPVVKGAQTNFKFIFDQNGAAVQPHMISQILGMAGASALA